MLSSALPKPRPTPVSEPAEPADADIERLARALAVRAHPGWDADALVMDVTQPQFATPAGVVMEIPTTEWRRWPLWTCWRAVARDVLLVQREIANG